MQGSFAFSEALFSTTLYSEMWTLGAWYMSLALYFQSGLSIIWFIMHRRNSYGDPCVTFLSHVGACLPIWRCVLLLSSCIWRQYFTFRKHSPFSTLLCIFLHWKVPLVCVNFQRKRYMFEGISHHLGSSHITQGVFTYVETWFIILVVFWHHLHGNKEVNRECPSWRLTYVT